MHPLIPGWSGHTLMWQAQENFRYPVDIRNFVGKVFSLEYTELDSEL